MPAIKLTKGVIDRARAPDPSGRQKLIWDSELKGFGLLVSGTTNVKSYVAQRTLPDGRTRRLTIGSVAEIDVDRARRKAADLIHEMRTGDPKAARKSAAAWTLRRALDEYVKARKDLKSHTIRDYRNSIERYLADWLDLALASITTDMVEAKHRQIQADIERRKAARAKAAGRGSAQPEHWNSSPGAHMANSVMITFRALWNFVEVRAPELPRNPVRILRRQWYANPRRDRLVRAEELPAFYRAVDALENDVAQDFVKLLLFTGLRRSEAAALRWEEIDFATKTIRLPAKRTKAGRRLDLPMSSFVRDLLVGRRGVGNDHGWVFGADSRSGHIEEPSSAFDAIAKDPG